VKDDTDFEALARQVLDSADARAAFLENGVRREVAKAFEAKRVERALSIRDLAKEIGTSVSQVQRLLHTELGGGLTLRTLCRAADALDMRLSVHVRNKSAHGCVVDFGKPAWSSVEAPAPRHTSVELKRKIIAGPPQGRSRSEWRTATDEVPRREMA
jgi:transcriptional regulator with XRE-family HTH domain